MSIEQFTDPTVGQNPTGDAEFILQTLARQLVERPHLGDKIADLLLQDIIAKEPIAVPAPRPELSTRIPLTIPGRIPPKATPLEILTSHLPDVEAVTAPIKAHYNVRKRAAALAGFSMLAIVGSVASGAISKPAPEHIVSTSDKPTAVTHTAALADPFEALLQKKTPSQPAKVAPRAAPTEVVLNANEPVLKKHPEIADFLDSSDIILDFVVQHSTASSREAAVAKAAAIKHLLRYPGSAHVKGAATGPDAAFINTLSASLAKTDWLGGHANVYNSTAKNEFNVLIAELYDFGSTSWKADVLRTAEKDLQATPTNTVTGPAKG